ncbi:hepatopoietin HPO1 [Eremomyces bilateralis CBS 781.70]|uniref:Sulfhydryl oxidase n=1 Tax=Eremomyces bilateralis CBS 781.70 TaxID=1392243 RepID=A0A6G1GDV8_9PEZI|nr:hepatopoietin HPO1 [Eremomyces bilateralis CBS 781.70]KAF1816212.1 hepatopoietin HPO1 [Eremomyces bilateralis CBS 781.70]
MSSTRDTKEPTNSSEDHPSTAALPKGVVLGPDGKPCRTCTPFASWKAMMASDKPSSPSTISTPSTSPTRSTSTSATSFAAEEPPSDCPPDVAQLGRSTWTLLHALTASYPTSPSPTTQTSALTFVTTLSQLYPCWHCAGDFRAWMSRPGNAPRVKSRAEFGQWMCEAHNEVNRKLGKDEFDCGKWEERWRTGWKDGRCD